MSEVHGGGDAEGGGDVAMVVRNAVQNLTDALTNGERCISIRNCVHGR